MVELRRLAHQDIERIGEVDRSEHVTGEYVMRDGALERRDLDLHVPPWSTTGTGEHSVRGNIDAWQYHLEKDGTLLGAIESGKLVGFAIYRPRLRADMGQLAILFVSRPFRGQGVGGRLTRQVMDLARADGARRLYVSATPTVATVDFYRGLGFELTAEPDPELLRLEPLDIHMIASL